MIVYHDVEKEGAPVRAHPWTTAEHDASQAYVDFKVYPELIRSNLEDLGPYKGFAFAEEFYGLLEWLNGPGCKLESNDCAFRGPAINHDAQFPYKMRCDGRLMILFRDLVENTQPRAIDWLLSSCMDVGTAINPVFRAGAIGVSRQEVCYLDMHPEPNKGAKGQQVMLSLFAYGKNERKCYESMAKLLSGLRLTLQRISKRVAAGAVDELFR